MSCLYQSLILKAKAKSFKSPVAHGAGAYL